MQASEESKILFGTRLKEERERLGFTQEAFGAGGGVTRLTQSKYEKNENYPDIKYLLAIEEMGVDFNYVLHGERRNYKSLEEVHNQYAVLAGQVVHEIEKVLSAKGATLSPTKKALLVGKIFRNSRVNSAISKILVEDFVETALD